MELKLTFNLNPSKMVHHTRNVARVLLRYANS